MLGVPRRRRISLVPVRGLDEYQRQTRRIAIPFVIEMIVAMLSTKISMYFGDVTSSTTAGATSDRILGGFTRDSLRICADHGRSLPAD